MYCLLFCQHLCQTEMDANFVLEWDDMEMTESKQFSVEETEVQTSLTDMELVLAMANVEQNIFPLQQTVIILNQHN